MRLIYFVNRDEENYILIEEKLKQGRKTNWKNSIGTHIIGKYKNTEFDFEVLEYLYQKGNPRLSICHNGDVKILYPSAMKTFKGFDMLLDFKSRDFLYNVGYHVKDDKRDFVITDRKKDRDKNGYLWKYYKIQCNKCGFDSSENYYLGEYRDEYWIEERSMKSGAGCGCCSSQFCVTGINDMWTTNPKVAELLEDEEEGYKNCIGTNRKLNFTCPNCGSIRSLRPYDVKKYGKVTCICSDSFSYPEKFTYCLLKQLDVNFIWQYSSHDCKWIRDRRKYDFYFKLNNEEYIIETHGMQHYESSFVRINSNRNRSLKEEQDNDKYKYEMAINNGIKPQNYIVIDFRESNLEWGKEHIINSKLCSLFNLNFVNWKECNSYALSSKVIEVCKLKESNPNYTIKDICKITGIGVTSVRNSLKNGKTFKEIDYEYSPRKHGDGLFLKVETIDGMFIGNFRSTHELDRMSNYLFGRHIDYRNIFRNLTTGGSVFDLIITPISEEEYYKNCSIFNKHTIKNKIYKLTYKDEIKYFNSYRQMKIYIKEKYNIALGEKSFKKYLNKKEKWNGFYIESILLSKKEQDNLIAKGAMIDGKI